MKKRNKTPIVTSLGALADRSHFKGKSGNKLLGWWRPRVTATIKPLTYAPVKPIR